MAKLDFSLKKYAARKSKVLKGLSEAPCFGSTVGECDVLDLASRVWYAISPSSMRKAVYSEAVVMWLREHVGECLDASLVNQLAEEAAGWTAGFLGNQNFVVIPGRWNLFLTFDAEPRLTLPTKDRRHKRSYQCTFKGIVGDMAGKCIVENLSQAQMFHILYSLGLPRFDKYIPEDLVGMYFIARTPQNSRTMLFEDARSEGVVLAANKSLKKAREAFCPRVLRACFNCGLSTAQCPYSRHVREYLPGTCKITSSKIATHRGYIVQQGICLGCIKTGAHIPYLLGTGALPTTVKSLQRED